MQTFYCYFRGGGGADIGAEQAGYTSIGGVEFDQAIAVACDVNFPDSSTTVADVCAVDPAALLSSAPSWFHASPSCRNASQAKSDAGEAQEDRDAGLAVARFIAHWLPPVVTIENVWGYRTFDAFGSICQALRDASYSYEFWHLNAASYGVPQTRKRLILIAKHGLHRIQRPEPTHRDGGDMWLPPWQGWYEAIEDLIPTLPESRFAPWQLARLPAEFVGSVLAHPNADNDRFPAPRGCQPAFTVATFQAGLPRAFIVDGMPNDHGASVTVRHSDEPMMTVSANGDKRKMRAFLMRSQNTQQEGGNQVRYEDTPAMTITAEEKPRAFLVSGQSVNGGPPVQRNGDQPTMTITPNMDRARAWLRQGRIVSMVPRCLARFQSFPDTYVLPEKNALACKIIGNACPPLLFQRIMEQAV